MSASHTLVKVAAFFTLTIQDHLFLPARAQEQFLVSPSLAVSGQLTWLVVCHQLTLR